MVSKSTIPQDDLTLICEDNFGGHRWTYVQYLLEAARTRNRRVAVVTTKAAAEDLASRRRGEDEQFPVHHVAEFKLSKLAEIADRLGASRVVVPDGDRDVLRLGLGSPWGSNATLAILVMRSDAQPRRHRISTAVIQAARSSLFFVAERRRRVEVYYLVSALQTNLSNPRLVPDPVAYAPGQAIFAPDPSTFTFAIVGALDERKNIALAIAAMSRITEFQLRLILAGAQTPGVAADVSQNIATFPVIEIPRRLSDGELDAVVRDSDVLLLLYSNNGPSGLMAKAAAAGTRVVASNTPAFAGDQLILPDSIALTPLNSDDVAQALRDVMTREKPAPMPLGMDVFVNRLLG